MTPLNKPVTRKSSAMIRDQGKIRELVITVYPNDTIGIRPLGTRREEVVTLAAVYSLGVKQRLVSELKEKIKRKKGRLKA